MINPTRRSIGVIAGAASINALLSPRSFAQPESTRNKLVVQVSDADAAKWNLALNNVKNVQANLPDDATDIEVVAYGPGIGMLKGDSPVAQRVAEALNHGVKVVACEATMKGLKLNYADMLPGVGFVPAGVVEIMRKQQQGYAYIRP